MGILDNLFGKGKKANPIPKSQEKDFNSGEEHAVIVQFAYNIQSLDPLHALEEKLEQVIQATMVGEYDGHEIAVDYTDGLLYMYGPDAEALFKAVKPTLDETSFMKGAKAVLRFGPPEGNVKEIEIIINE